MDFLDNNYFQYLEHERAWKTFTYKDRRSILIMDGLCEDEFKNKFQFSKDGAGHLIDILQDKLE